MNFQSFIATPFFSLCTIRSFSKKLDVFKCAHEMGTILHEIPEDPNEDEKSAKSLDATPYEKVLSIVHDPKNMHEIGLSRIGLYKFCGDIGKGNFSRVKKAVHLLTKGI